MLLPDLGLAEPNQQGQSGLINMPDARIDPEGTWRIGFSSMKPYSALWSSISLFSRLEMSARYTEIDKVQAFTDKAGANYGNFKDKAFDAKIILREESHYWPQLAAGSQDFFGTQVFSTDYLTLSKRFTDFDITLGYGEKRLDGLFGGLRYAPKWAAGWSILAEYDAIAYQSDYSAQQSAAVNRSGGETYAIHYRWGWLGAQLGFQNGDYGLNGYIAIPLMQPQFIAKLDEPKPYVVVHQRLRLSEWQENAQPTADLFTALDAQQFRNIRIKLSGERLDVALATPRITLIGRAVGRAARTSLAMAPKDLKSIRIIYYTLNDLPVVSYEFKDLAQLEAFFAGYVTYGELLKTTEVSYVAPEDVAAVETESMPSNQSSANSEGQGLHIARNEDGQIVSLRQSDRTLSSFHLTPLQVNIFFNDPSGAFKYDWFMRGNYSKYLGTRWFFETSATATVLENVSDVVQQSDSTLAHVRTDVADYKRERGLKLDRLLLNKFVHLRPRVYARWSAGIYEEMFGGTGGQILYLPSEANWAVDVNADWLQQRDVDGGLTFRDYTTVSALLNLHYRIPTQGVTLTARSGRFLAKDSGVSLEFARRFASGFQIGAWYTRTDGNDTTGPGSAGDPYFDKGIFIQIPLNTMLTKDTRAVPSASIRPWTRDVGQQVRSPADLYSIMENVFLFDRPEHHLLTGFHE